MKIIDNIDRSLRNYIRFSNVPSKSIAKDMLAKGEPVPACILFTNWIDNGYGLSVTFQIFDNDLAQELISDGWNLKIQSPYGDETEATYKMEAKIKFRNKFGEPVKRTPKIYIVTDSGITKRITEENMEKLSGVNTNYISAIVHLGAYDAARTKFSNYLTEADIYVSRSSAPTLHPEFEDKFEEFDIGSEAPTTEDANNEEIPW